MSRDGKLYTAAEAEKLGRRLICAAEGHRLKIAFDDGLRGGVQGLTQANRAALGFGRAARPAACDEISCLRCDVVFTATYPPMEERS